MTEFIYDSGKDEELSYTKKELKKNYYRGFPISEKQNKEIKRWKEKHEREYHKTNPYSDSIGGNYTYLFTPTSIGTIGVVRCKCGAEFTFQDL